MLEEVDVAGGVLVVEALEGDDADDVPDEEDEELVAVNELWLPEPDVELAQAVSNAAAARHVASGNLRRTMATPSRPGQARLAAG